MTGKVNTLPAPRREGYRPAGRKVTLLSLCEPHAETVAPRGFGHRAAKRSAILGG